MQGLGASEESEAPVLLPGPPRIRESHQSLYGQLAVYLIGYRIHMDIATLTLPADAWVLMLVLVRTAASMPGKNRITNSSISLPTPQVGL